MRQKEEEILNVLDTLTSMIEELLILSNDHLMYDTGLTFTEIAAVYLQHIISQFDLDPAFEVGRALNVEECI
jgi:hypothetical protein